MKVNQLTSPKSCFFFLFFFCYSFAHGNYHLEGKIPVHAGSSRHKGFCSEYVPRWRVCNTGLSDQLNFSFKKFGLMVN